MSPESDRYRWAILAVGVVAQASFSALFFGIPVLAPALRSEYRLTLAQLGVVLASVSVGMVLTVLPWGVLADRISERAVMATGLAIATASLVAAATAGSFAWLVVALTGAGAFGACVQAASGRAVMGWFDVTERGFALAIRQTAVVVGGAFAALALPVATN
ncbi:MAG: MFS transporter, partial [Actinobacteria bacterium]|nr:MFS transporter [Actinomycetota bacterium]